MADQIDARAQGKATSSLVPGVADGAEGIAFVDAAIRSHQANGGWVKLAG
jgi:hypothetical protein